MWMDAAGVEEPVPASLTARKRPKAPLLLSAAAVAAASAAAAATSDTPRVGSTLLAGRGEAAAAGLIRPGHVVVLRGLGPVASGMPEVLVATAALGTPDLKGKVAFISDTRVSGVSHGIIGVHGAPEAAVGGPIGRVRDGDRIEFDLLAGTIHCDADLAAREPGPGPTRPTLGYLADWAVVVTQANHGCVSRWTLDEPTSLAAS